MYINRLRNDFYIDQGQAGLGDLDCTQALPSTGGMLDGSESSAGTLARLPVKLTMFIVLASWVM